MNPFVRFFPGASLIMFLSFSDNRIPFEPEMLLGVLMVIVVEISLLITDAVSNGNLYNTKIHRAARAFLGVFAVIPLLFLGYLEKSEQFEDIYSFYYGTLALVIILFLPLIFKNVLAVKEE